MKYNAVALTTDQVQSLPSRERGLKFFLPVDAAGSCPASLPSRERGLKSNEFLQPLRNMLSLPSRERGLK